MADVKAKNVYHGDNEAGYLLNKQLLRFWPEDLAQDHWEA